MPPNKERVIGRTEDGTALVNYLANELGCSLRKAKALLDERCVFVNGKRVWMAKHVLRRGDRVDIHAATSPTPQKTKARPTPSILFESDDYVVADKPAGLLSNGPDSVESICRACGRWPFVKAVHRLDKDTSGCLCLAKSDRAFERAVAFFREGQVQKVYQAIVRGTLPAQEGMITRPLEGQTAITHWLVLSSNPDATHVRIRIDTGRTHQIRKHFDGIGHPLLGDRTYMTGRVDDARVRAIPRQMLHAGSLEAPLAKDGSMVRTRAPLPRDFQSVLHAFRLR